MTPDAVTTAAMRRVMERRGWTMTAAGTAYERWERPDPHSFRSVLVPLAGADRRGDLVMLWADEVAERHGDVSPAEVLAEARAAEVAP